MTIEDIVRFCRERSVRWTAHILARLFQRNIRLEDVTAALTGGEIIEQYPSDYPFWLNGRLILEPERSDNDLFYV